MEKGLGKPHRGGDRIVVCCLLRSINKVERMFI